MPRSQDDWDPPTIVEAGLLPGLSAGGFAIRPCRTDDAAALFEAVNSSVAEVGPWLPWCHREYCYAESESWVATRAQAWARGSEFSFVIIDESTRRLLGGVGLNEINPQHRFANLGYWVRSGETGRGAASTATRLLARFGFLHVGLLRIEIVVAVGNSASLRTAEKAGAVREGVLRNRLLIHGESHDAVIFSLVPADLGLG